MSEQSNETWGISNCYNEAFDFIEDFGHESEHVSSYGNLPVQFHQFEDDEWTLSAINASVSTDMMAKIIADFEALSTTPFALEIAIGNYQRGLISLGRAAEMASLHYDTLMNELERRGIQLRLGPATPEEAEREERRFFERVRRSLSTDR